MPNSIAETIKQIWAHWNVQGAVLCSLCMQILLILFAPYRKRTGEKPIIMLIWSTYLLADAVAYFAVGLILNSQRYSIDLSASEDNSGLSVFWAPFLLLHLGGPDTITAFSLEDNQLWLRHLYAFAVQAVLTGYVFRQTLPSNKLWIPTSLVFVAGFIKSLERTCSLYLASKEKFRNSLLRKPNPGVDYGELTDTSGPMTTDKIQKEHSPSPTQTNIWDVLCGKVASEDVRLVCKAYRCFKLLRGLIVDLPPRVTDLKEIDSLWRDIKGGNALRMIEVELNFFYEVLYTKAVVVHSNWGMFFRFISVVAALVDFHFHVKKHAHFDKFDVGVTYALLFGDLALDILAFMMAILSDWTLIATLQINPKETRCFKLLSLFRDGIIFLFSKFLALKRPKIRPVPRGQHILVSLFIFQRWSRYVPGLNLIGYCLKRRPAKIQKVKYCKWIDKFREAIRTTITFTRINEVINQCCKVVAITVKEAIRLLKVDKALPYLLILWDKLVQWVGLGGFLDEMLYKSSERLTEELWEFIREELQRKSEQNTSEVICSARGEWVLQIVFQDEDCTKLRPYIVDVPFDESLLLWHIATELLYGAKNVSPRDESYTDRKFSKILSDYMLYLLIMQPTMMEGVSSGDQILRFQDTCAAAKRFFKSNGIGSTQLKRACKKILRVKMKNAPKEMKGEGSMSVLFEASMLAKALMRLEEKKWKVLSKVWAEMLSYAACQCSSSAHAQQISKGGEVITFVWLVMAHFGLVRKQFRKKREDVEMHQTVNLEEMDEPAETDGSDDVDLP